MMVVPMRDDDGKLIAITSECKDCGVPVELRLVPVYTGIPDTITRSWAEDVIGLFGGDLWMRCVECWAGNVRERQGKTLEELRGELEQEAEEKYG